MPTLSRKAYAEHAGVSPQNVSIWVAQGMPTVSPGQIDQDEADAWREANLDPAKMRSNRGGEVEPALIPAGAGAPTLAERRSELVAVQVKRQELFYQKDAGQLIGIAEAQQAIYARAKAERDAHLTWARSVATRIAGEVGCEVRDLQVAIEREMRLHLIELSEMSLDVLQAAAA